ncbi:GNAT family N-acetyltransferase [Victivallis sp. Marseille-Q1083]|uniref:GNAT family N-acetyltransferase n=1 Tax=Victivallis sp. Marseille-Q1083 TaxID=2717288 RepID=UPI00158A9D26|nr:GNAT family N-acetyltransferase [Victivallis sp. Marseille-Q1083]
MNIIAINQPRDLYLDALLQVWEASVRATHYFLTEEQIVGLRPLVTMGLQGIPHLYLAFDGEKIAGFMGIDGDKLEMLFLAPASFGCGLGRKMLQHGLTQHHLQYIDVNEQNLQARGFYEHCGFEVIGRSELDGQGNPFPILHLKIKEV